MKFHEAKEVLKYKSSSCFQYAMRARDGWVKGVVAVLAKGSLTQYLWDSRTNSWEDVGPVEGVGAGHYLESAEWDVDMLSAFE